MERIATEDVAAARADTQEERQAHIELGLYYRYRLNRISRLAYSRVD